MKRLYFSFFLLTFAILSSAQINLNDSTVSFVAYWSLGDKYNFEAVKEKTKINKSDTTVLVREDVKFSLEVIDSTETHYVLRYEPIESTSSKVKTPMDSLINEKLDSLFEDIPILLRTNHLGTLEGIHNWEEIKEVLEKSIEIFGDELLGIIPADKRDDIVKDKATFLANAFAPMLKKETLLASIKEAILLFRFHGGAYNIDEVYDYTEQRFSPWDGSLIDTTGEAWVEEIDVEDTYALVCNNNTFNSDQLITSYANYISKTYGDMGPLNLNELPYIFCKEHINASVHTDSGWTTRVYFQLRTEAGETAQLNTIKVNMLFDDEPEGNVEEE